MPPGVDLIYTSNVLEHIDDDLAALKQLRATLSPGGRIAIYVPAMQVLYSDMDRSLGHYRRYGRQELLAKLKVGKGDTLFVTDAAQGVTLTPYDPEFEQQMALARQIAKERRDVLRVLAT